MNFENFNKFSTRENPIKINENLDKVPLASDYTLVDPINISSTSDWALYPFITGNGSAIDPYIIENIEIQGNGVKTIEEYNHIYLNNSDNGIYINAVGNFTIRNCKISFISIGIRLGFGVSTGYNHSIKNVEINNCGIGIYSYWWHIGVNISKCHISNCNWVTVKTTYDFESPILYGGFGIWVRGEVGSNIEFCYVQNCSLGILAGPNVALISNQLVNCGFWFDFDRIFYYISIFNNTINGKPLGLFAGEHHLAISGQEASQYGQLIFVFCNNLQLSNILISDDCSFGIPLINCDHSILKNIICENQKIGFFFGELSDYIRADNLLAKNCDVGFFLWGTSHARLNKFFTENSDIPFYANTYYHPIYNSTIEIEKTTRFYLLDFFGFDTLYLNSSITSYILSPRFIPALDVECFLIQINDTYTYYVTDSDSEIVGIDFTIVIYQESQPSAIPGFPLFWFYIIILLELIILTVSFQRKKRQQISESFF